MASYKDIYPAALRVPSVMTSYNFTYNPSPAGLLTNGVINSLAFYNNSFSYSKFIFSSLVSVPKLSTKSSLTTSLANKVYSTLSSF
jgi:hypothetical protein